MEEQVGLGRKSWDCGRPPGSRTFRGAFERLFHSTSPIGDRGEPGDLQGIAFSSGSRRGRPAAPSYLFQDEPPTAPSSSSSAPSTPEFPGDLKATLEGDQAGSSTGRKEDCMGESAKELCSAVSASMGLPLEAPDEPSGPRGDCMFALPGALPHSRTVQAEMVSDLPPPLPPSSLHHQPLRGDFHDFQPALPSPHGSLNREERAAVGRAWSPQCRRPAELPAPVPHYAGLPPAWQPLLPPDDQLYLPRGAVPPRDGTFTPYGWSPAHRLQDWADLSDSDLRYPGRGERPGPFVPVAGRIKTDNQPCMEGCEGAYREHR